MPFNRLGAVSLACVLTAVASCGRGTETSRFTQKLVILGFDGLDPDLVARWISEKRLPNFQRLIAQGGGMFPLTTTHSPESPVAWASFATGVNPGKHNIYDFLVRDTATYRPALGMVRREPGEYLLDYVPLRKPKVHSMRGGTSFWVTAGRAGVRSSILTVPMTFPPEEVEHGELLSGLPLPDIRGTVGTFSYYATDLAPADEGATDMGGILRRLVMDNDVARTHLTGPPNPVARRQTQEVHVPMTVRWNRAARAASIDLAGQAVSLEPGRLSAWVDVEFRVNLFVRLHGMVQLRLMKADTELQLYVSPVNWKPEKPPLPISSPESFSGDLFRRLGSFRTLGWGEATAALNDGRMDDETFMDDLYRAFDDRAQVILDRIDARNWDVLVGVIESTDRVQHMMWRFLDPQHPMHDAAGAARFGDAIERVYRRADQFLGEALEHIDPGTAVFIVSDHGFHSWRKAVNLNTWLVEQGYMALNGRQTGDRKLADLYGGATFWENVDWSRTRAYAMGLGQIYVNLRGREASGIVNPGAEASQLTDELAAKLLTLEDPDDGSAIVRAVYKRDEIYSGEYLHRAPELQVGMLEGYRVSWQTALGGTPQGIVSPNMRKWSGDHGGYDFATTAGVLLTNRPILRRDPAIVDIAPTVLKFFGLPIPGDIDGKPLF